MSLNKDMGDRHEEFLAEIFGGYASRGSGNQWHNPMDGRTPRTRRYSYAWDGKSTLMRSVGITREMWAKAVDQSGGHTPMIALRFYDNETLDVGLDLGVVNLHDLAELIETANNCDCTHDG